MAYKPAWLQCLTHGLPKIGAGSENSLEAHLHIDDHDEQADEAEAFADEAPLCCTTMKFEFKRSAYGAFESVDYPGFNAGHFNIPMCVCDMPDILDKLSWS